MKRLLPLLPFLLLTACAERGVPPMQLTGTAYEAAAIVSLPETPPREYPGLHNVYWLGDHILSGSEPEHEEAFAELARQGIRTIVSVDGKVPDATTAAMHGMAYVHVPIQYSGITRDELLSLAKTFREIEGPFYVHCFHGKHRGPAAAAVGRLAMDGVSRELALAEMRQWCSTAEKYEGLYHTIATTPVPTASETAAWDFDFAPAHRMDGMRSVMIEMTRKWDLVKAAAKRDWAVDPDHPDVVPLQEATQLHQLYSALAELDDTAARPADYRGWVDDGVKASADLVRALSSCTTDEEIPSVDPEAAYRAVAASCTACHTAYRN